MIHADDVPEQIARLDQRIEALGDIVERCRKVALGARVAIAAGALWIAATMLGVIHGEAAATLAAIAAVIGGTVAAGSNRTTRDLTLRAIDDAEGERAGLIDRLDLQVVRDRARAPGEAAALAGGSS